MIPAVLAVMALAALINFGWYRHARRKRRAELDARYAEDLDRFLREGIRRWL